MSGLNLEFNRVKHAKGSNRKGPKDASEQYFSGDYYKKTDTLVRETIQNPLDNPSGNGPVKIVFRQRYVKTDEIPNRRELIKTMESLHQAAKKLQTNNKGIAVKFVDRYKNAAKSLKNTDIGILQISDYNTTGLTGSKNDMSSNIGRFLGGVGYFDDASAGGGSGGLGKYAPFQFSGINFCLYSSLNEKKEFIYYGWGSNFTHEQDEVEYTGEINMGSSDGDDYDVCKSAEKTTGGFLSERDELGTDVFALGFIKGEQASFIWSEEMTKAVIRNFFGSIIDKKLIVEIVEYEKDKILITNDTIVDLLDLFNENERKSSNDILADGYTVEGVKTFIDGEHFVSNSVQTPILGKCIVKVKQDDDFSSYFTYMRGPRMLIKNSRARFGDLPFGGVFICTSDEGNNALRNLEDSHHRDWIYSTSQDKKIRAEINAFIKYCVEKVAKFENPDEFNLKGTSILSLGASSGNAPGSGDGEEDKEAAVAIPKNIVSSGIKSNSFSGEYKVDKDGKKKKVKPKKKKYKKPDDPPIPRPSTTKKREYRVDDFKAVIFKNDEVENEYHLFIESNEISNIRTIDFKILGENVIPDLSFIDSIQDD
ncbi:MAG: hypothetical protein P8O83_03705, partial [Flavobacteriaceae bacterium]|nr:hypothetical protein [Flavobacteriaceae bacterium]